MIVITNLTCLEDVNSDVLGGRGRRVYPAISAQTNVAIVRQNSIAGAKAFAIYGDAVAFSTSVNNSNIGQDNFQS